MPGIPVITRSTPLIGARKVSEKVSVSFVGLAMVALAAGLDDTSLLCALATPGRESANAAAATAAVVVPRRRRRGGDSEVAP